MTNSKPEPSVGIVTINLNQKETAQQFVNEVRKQTYANYHLYIVDNGSDPEQQIDSSLCQLDSVSYIQTGKNLGFAGGNNVGIGQALKDSCEFVWIVNNDTSLQSDCLVKLVNYLQENPGVGIVGPKIYYEYEGEDEKRIWFAGGKINWNRPFPYQVNTHYGEREIDFGQYDQTRPVDFITGCSMLIRADLLQKVGGFEEKYFLFYEDADLCLKAKKLDQQTVYLPEATMTHQVGLYTKSTSAVSSYCQIYSWLTFVSRWAPWWSKFIAYSNIKLILGKNQVKLFIPSKNVSARAELKAFKDFIFGRPAQPPSLV